MCRNFPTVECKISWSVRRVWLRMNVQQFSWRSASLKGINANHRIIFASFPSSIFAKWLLERCDVLVSLPIYSESPRIIRRLFFRWWRESSQNILLRISLLPCMIEGISLMSCITYRRMGSEIISKVFFKLAQALEISRVDGSEVFREFQLNWIAFSDRQVYVNHSLSLCALVYVPPFDMNANTKPSHSSSTNIVQLST